MHSLSNVAIYLIFPIRDKGCSSYSLTTNVYFSSLRGGILNLDDWFASFAVNNHSSFSLFVCF